MTDHCRIQARVDAAKEHAQIARDHVGHCLAVGRKQLRALHYLILTSNTPSAQRTHSRSPSTWYAWLGWDPLRYATASATAKSFSPARMVHGPAKPCTPQMKLKARRTGQSGVTLKSVSPGDGKALASHSSCARVRNNPRSRSCRASNSS